jgi:hypothetical protein
LGTHILKAADDEDDYEYNKALHFAKIFLFTKKACKKCRL